MNAMPPPAAMPVSAPTLTPSQPPAGIDAPAKAAPKASPQEPSKSGGVKDTPKNTPHHTGKSTPKADPAKGASSNPDAAKDDAASGNDSTADFALALAQTTSAATQSTTKTAPAKTAAGDDGSIDAELAAMQAGVSMQIPQQLPQTPQTNVAMRAGGADDGVDLLAAVTQKVGKDMQALLDELASASDRTSGTTESSKTVDVPQMPTLPVTQADTRQQPSAVADAQTKPMHTPVGTQAWADELGNRVTFLATQGHQTASLKLTPEHLGPLEVRISIRDDQASVWFGAAHADTRAAIEHALPKLREQFASQGLSLTDAGVFREPPRDNSRRAPSGNGVGALQDAPAESTLAVVVRRWGLVDAYV